MSARRRTLPPRDQEASAFSGILMRLCEGTGANGVALVDQGGETVDYAGYRDPFALRVMAAEWRIVLDIVRATEKPLVLELPRRGFDLSRRALAEAAREIEAEAELPTTTALTRERWSRVEVRTVPGDRRRPEAVWLDGAWQAVVILGRHHAHRRPGRPGKGEVAYRARMPNGLEFALVREPLGTWFASDV
jgi:hypothetical protein